MIRPSKLLNVLYVGMLPPHPGGSAVVGAQLVLGLARLGHSVRAVAPITAEILSSGDEFATRHPEVSITRIEVPYFAISLSMAASGEYRKSVGNGISEKLPILLAEQEPDVIVIGKEDFAWHIAKESNASAVPSILLVHTPPSKGRLGNLGPDMTQELLHLLQNLDLVVLVAEHMAVELQELQLSNFVVIPNGVDLHSFSPSRKEPALLRALAIRDDQIVVVHSSNLKEVKRPLDIVSSAERVLRDNPAVVYVIVGDGPYRERMEDLCREKQIMQSFRFVGWVEHERVPEYFNLADIVVMPSQAEALALAYLEAQACGRLLLASDIPAAREVIQDGQTGLLFRTGDIDDLSAKTLRASGDANVRAAIGRRAREAVKAHDLNTMLTAYDQALRAVADCRDRDRPR